MVMCFLPGFASNTPLINEHKPVGIQANSFRKPAINLRLPKKSISETVESEFPSLAKLEAGDAFFWTGLDDRKFGKKITNGKMNDEIHWEMVSGRCNELEVY